MKKTLFAGGALLLALEALGANGLTLWADRPAQFFEETFVIGNGNIGAIVYGGTQEEVLSLNDITLWSGGPDTVVYSPDAYKHIPAIREALAKEDYAESDRLLRNVQGHYTEAYQPLGMLKIAYANHGEATGYRRELDLQKAVAQTAYEIEGEKFKAEYFASAPDSVIVVRLSSGHPQGIWATVSLDSRLPHKVGADGQGRIVSEGYAPAHTLPSYTPFDNKVQFDERKGTRFLTVVHALPKGKGEVETTPDGEIKLKGCSEVVLLVTNVTSFSGPHNDPVTQGRDYKSLAKRRIDAAQKMGFNSLRQRHEKDYSNLFGRVSLYLGKTDDRIKAQTTEAQLKAYTDQNQHNPELEALYFQYGRYLLISCSRTKGVPANLQGLWNESVLPPWSCNYTTNINVEENYWPAEVTGLGELHRTALLEWIKQLPVTGRATAKAYYGVERGWCLGHNSDIWAMTCPVGLRSGDPMWANWNMGGAWVSSHLWDHYLFGGDKEYLAQTYPVLKGAAEFCLDWLVEHTDGTLITSPGTSPENHYVTDGGYHGASLYGAMADLAMVRQCLMDARDAAKVMADDAFAAEAEVALGKLARYRIGRDGNFQEWYHDWRDEDPRHRHQSHLYGVHPGRHITLADDPALIAAASKTLDVRGENTTGWSAGWRVNLRARFGEGNNAYTMLRRLLRYVSPDGYRGEDARRGGGTYPNMLDAHAPFQIDGNFGGTAGVAEMLIQSTPETVTLLPALADAWSSEGEVKGLRARTGVSVDMKWCNGKVIEYVLQSLRTEPLTTIVKCNGMDYNHTLQPGKSVRVRL